MLFVFLFLGCSNETVPDDPSPSPMMSEQSPSPAETPSEAPAEPEIDISVDMAGRPIELPETIENVYGSNNNSTILLYTLAPEKMIGWNLQMSKPAQKYLGEYASLPVLGNLYGSGKKASVEEVLTYEPDIVLLANTKINDKVIEDADALELQLGVPVVVIEANIDNYDEAYMFLGAVLGIEEKADALAAYYQSVYDDVANISAAIDEDDKVSVYYARLDDGLTTEFAGSANAELLELVGARNIAVSEGKETGGEVTIEQVLVWEPDVILVGHIGANESLAYEAITTGEVWRTLGAVANGLVYEVPRFPFNWFDRPPSVNRIIGMKWLGNLLYPDLYEFSTADVQTFFELYYGFVLSKEDVQALLG